ncbi:MAG: ABC transporter permease [Prolixibacteraceae bacterium]|nr:ABC transporter permease [Burkholderiales bacterium]
METTCRRAAGTSRWCKSGRSTKGSSASALWLTHLLIIDFHPWTLTAGDFTRMIAKVLDMPALLVLWGKTIAFGFAVTVIPISEGLNTPQKLFYAPISVLRGMVRLFFSLMVIEAAALAIVYV